MKPPKATAAASRSQGARKRIAKASKKAVPAPSKRPAPTPKKKAAKKADSPVKKNKRKPAPKGRPPGLDTSWHEKFLEVLSSVPFITHAAEKAGTTPQTAYAHRKADPEFAKRWDEAQAQGNVIAPDLLQKTAWELAVIGVERKRYNKDGDLEEEWIERDTKILSLLLKAKCPEFRDKVEHSGSVFIPLDQLAARVSASDDDEA